MKTKVYLDFNATTPVDPGVCAELGEAASRGGNPSSIHWAGRESKNWLRETRLSLARSFDVNPLELIFNSGATEGSNTVIQGVFREFSQNRGGFENRNHYLCSDVEHPSVKNTFQKLKSWGAHVDFIPVNRRGELDLDFFHSRLSSKTALVSVMMANNETGNVFPVQELTRKAHEVGALFHCDAVQALGKIPFSLKKLDVDYACFSAHKFYALKGLGVLYVKKGSPFVNAFYGGAQERQRRPGTENILGVWSLGKMASRLNETEFRSQEMKRLRDLFEEKTLREIPGVEITGKESLRISNTSSLVIAGVDGETLLMSLDLKGYAVSTGAACSSGNPEPSPVLLAMGLRREEAQSSLRISLGWSTTESEILAFCEALKETVQRLRNLSQDATSEKLRNLS